MNPAWIWKRPDGYMYLTQWKHRYFIYLPELFALAWCHEEGGDPVQVLPLGEYTMDDPGADSTDLYLKSPSQSYLLRFDLLASKEDWVQQLNTVVENFNKNPGTLAQPTTAPPEELIDSGLRKLMDDYDL